MDIRAETTGIIQSVRFSIFGPGLQETRVENIPAWTLFGNEGDSYNGRKLSPGSYTIIAQPFSETRARGIAGPTLTKNFIIQAPPTPSPPTPSPQTMSPSTPRPTLPPSPSPTRAPLTPRPISAPTLRSTPSPTRMPTEVITNTETMIEIPQMKISRFVLVDAETNQDIPGGLYCDPFVCTGGATIMDIRAETSGAGIQSVKFTIDGPVKETRTENIPGTSRNSALFTVYIVILFYHLPRYSLESLWQ